MSSLRFERLCTEAKQAFAQRDWDKAREIYLQALTLEKDVPDVHQGLATIYFQMKDLRNAMHHFREVTRLDPRRAGAFINLGAILNLLDELDEAQSALRKGIQLDPHRAEGFYNLALVYRRKKQIDLAIQAYQEAIRVNPRLADAHYNLGNIYMERMEYRDAMRCYEEALEAKPNWEKAKRALAQAEQAVLHEEDSAYASKPKEEPAATSEEAPETVRSSNIDPHKVLDPDRHGKLLDRMHADAKQAQTSGEEFQELLLNELEPAIKDLSASLLRAGGRGGTLESSFHKYDQVLRKVRELKTKVFHLLETLQDQGEMLTSLD